MMSRPLSAIGTACKHVSSHIYISHASHSAQAMTINLWCIPKWKKLHYYLIHTKAINLETCSWLSIEETRKPSLTKGRGWEWCLHQAWHWQCDLDLLLTFYCQSWLIHASALLTTCANLQHNQFIHLHMSSSHANTWFDKQTRRTANILHIKVISS